MEASAQTSPLRIALRALVGALIGLALGVALWALLFRMGFVLPRARARLEEVGPPLLAWLVVLGALAGGVGRRITRAVEAVALPPGLPEETRRLWWLAVSLVGLAILHYHVAALLLGNPTDLPSFLLAARAMRAGADIYDPQVIASFADGTTVHEVIYPYLYLPLYAVLLAPLSYLSQAGAHAVFLVFNALLWPLLIYLCLRSIEAPERLRAPLSTLVLVISVGFLPATQTYLHGSASLLVAVLTVAVLVLEREERHPAAGALLALVVLIKIVPVVLVGYLLLRRRLRVVLWAGCFGLGLLALSVAVAGAEAHLHWLSRMAPELARGAQTGTFFEPACHPANQALTGVYCRLLGSGTPLYRTLASATAALLVAIAALVLWRRRAARIDRLEGALVCVVILLVSTITWFHHMTLMLLPALTLIAVGAERRGRGGAAVLACGMVVLAVVGFEFYLDPWPFVIPSQLTHSLRFQAMVLAFVALVMLIATQPAPGATSPAYGATSPAPAP